MDGPVAMQNSKPGKSVFITGGGRGIGKAIASTYSKNGWRVIAPPRAELDLSSLAAVQEWLARTTLEVDVLVNNAGENNIQPLAELSLENWQNTLTVNLTSAMLLMQACSRHMRARRWGRIVNISSIFAHVSRSGRAPYAAAKTGVIGLTRTAALEWARDNVLVNAVCPGYVETDLTRKNNSVEQLSELAKMVPIGRLGQPEEIARVVFFLGSEQNSFITGQSLTADGGFTAQ